MVFESEMKRNRRGIRRKKKQETNSLEREMKQEEVEDKNGQLSKQNVLYLPYHIQEQYRIIFC